MGALSFVAPSLARWWPWIAAGAAALAILAGAYWLGRAHEATACAENAAVQLRGQMAATVAEIERRDAIAAELSRRLTAARAEIDRTRTITQTEAIRHVSDPDRICLPAAAVRVLDAQRAARTAPVPAAADAP